MMFKTKAKPVFSDEQLDVVKVMIAEAVEAAQCPCQPCATFRQNRDHRLRQEAEGRAASEFMESLRAAEPNERGRIIMGLSKHELSRHFTKLSAAAAAALTRGLGGVPFERLVERMPPQIGDRVRIMAAPDDELEQWVEVTRDRDGVTEMRIELDREQCEQLTEIGLDGYGGGAAGIRIPGQFRAPAWELLRDAEPQLQRLVEAGRLNVRTLDAEECRGILLTRQAHGQGNYFPGRG